MGSTFFRSNNVCDRENYADETRTCRQVTKHHLGMTSYWSLQRPQTRARGLRWSRQPYWVPLKKLLPWPPVATSRRRVIDLGIWVVVIDYQCNASIRHWLSKNSYSARLPIASLLARRPQPFIFARLRSNGDGQEPI